MSWFGYPMIGGVLNAVAAGVGAFFGGVSPFYAFMPRLPCFTQGMHCFNTECQMRHAKTCPYHANPNWQPGPPSLEREPRSEVKSNRTHRPHTSQVSTRSNFQFPTQDVAQLLEQNKALEKQIRELERLLLDADQKNTRHGDESVNLRESELSSVQSESSIHPFNSKA